jgi:hypothetical protein
MIHYDNTAIDAVNEGRDTPDAFYHKSTLIATSEYVHTDGWRGYTKIKPVQGFKEVEADWVTGDWDDAPEGNSSSEVEAKIKELEKQYGDIFVIFAPTSNVFSTSYAVIVRDPDAVPLKGKTIAHKTKRYDTSNGGWRVQYHATDVVTYDPNKQPHYTLNTGGWDTMTTAKRMTDALPSGYYVYRRNWIMYVHTPDGDRELKDGMEV